MSFDPLVALKVKSYKSFADEPQGFDRIAPINIIIGRNNSGKSTLIDLVDYATNPSDINRFGHKGNTPIVELTNIISESNIRSVFPDNTSGGPISGNHYQYGQQWIGKPLTVELKSDNNKSFIKLEPEMISNFISTITDRLDNPFKSYKFKRILAERNITPEATSNNAPQLQANGDGVSDLIRHFLHESTADQTMVEDKLLIALNDIFKPDTAFTRIQAKKLQGQDVWEIYLEEADKGSIALSNSGSGLKTIMQVLAQTILIPNIESAPISKYLLCFEELENNLHPGLQRRLFTYLRNLAVEHDATLFITTHSNVVIDLFSGDDQAQLLHVTHDNISAKVKTMSNHLDGSGVLDDLDIRASDILQSNGVIWVEGPSDRVYINKYIELMSNSQLREGAHYQCVFYGGRLLARVTSDPQNNDDVNLLKVNRNASIVMDSDKRTSHGRINATKQRMKSEIESINGYVWITDQKEIENCIPVEALRAVYDDNSMPKVGDFDSFSEYLDGHNDGEGKQFLANKVLFAERVIPHVTKQMIETDDKLTGHVKKLCAIVASWNKISNS